MVKVGPGIIPSEVIELLHEPMQSLSFVQIVLLELWVLRATLHRVIDLLIELVYVWLLKPVMSIERERHTTRN
jgi:hypothetical protein